MTKILIKLIENWDNEDFWMNIGDIFQSWGVWSMIFFTVVLIVLGIMY